MSNSLKGWCDSNFTHKGLMNILYLPCNKSQFAMALIYAERSKHNSYIYAAEYELQSRTYVAEHPDSNARFILTRDSVASLLPAIDRVVIFVGSVSPFISKDINIIVSTCLKVKKPVVEVPHGLFQSGYNLVDNSKLIHTRSHDLGFGGPLPSVSNYKLKWYGEDGIGYPRTVFRNCIKNFVLPEFTLITTNTNWYLYSLADKRAFFKVLFDYVERKEEKLFIWCPHTAEMSAESFSINVVEFRPRNMMIYGLEKDIYFNGLEGADDLIPYCSYGISTLSTCLLDYEIYSKRVNVFNCNGVIEILKTIKNKSLFTEANEITPGAQVIETGYLKEFDPTKLDEMLSLPVSEDSFVSHHYLTSFM